jgi:formylglycine-generating enzyme
MGSPEGEAGRFDDEVQHEVVLTYGYWLGETPLTQALWEAVMGANPSRFKGADRPVETVCWDDSLAFVGRLNALVPGLDVGLPTEAEWEYACRAGTTMATWVGDLSLTETGHAKELDAIAWYFRNSVVRMHAVREKAANPWGLYDMLGNVWEWCSDWHAPYDTTPAVDPLGETRGTKRILRGGSWVSNARYVRAARRLAYDPRDASEGIGLRLARGQSTTLGATLERGASGGDERLP